MNVTLVTSSLTCGGAEKNIALLANEWSKRGASVSVVSFNRHPPFFELASGVRLVTTDTQKQYRSLWRDALTAPARIGRIRRAITDTQPNLIISFMEINNLLTLLSTRGLGIPVIVAERSDPAIWPTQTGWRLLRRLLYPLATKVITQTEEAKAFFPTSLQKKITVIPNPVPAFEGALNLPGKLQMMKILSVGRVVPMKRFDLLLSAMAQLHGDFPEWTVDIVGDGEARANLEQKTRDLGLTEVVRWRGTLKDLRPVLQDASLFVLCSEFEGFPNALSEALAAGIPAIATDTQGARRLVRDGENGLRIPINDLNALTQALRHLMQDAALRRKMSEEALRVTELFSVDHVVNLWRDAARAAL